MKLVALWIEDYKNLKDITFNFGDELHFKIEFKKENQIINLDTEKTDSYYDLFQGKKLLNISGILGVNGSGKSNLFRLLNLLEAGKPISGEILLIYKKENTYKISKYISEYPILFGRKPLTINFSESMQKETLFHKKFEINTEKDFFQNSQLIFYSSEFSNYNENLIQKNNVFNRSTNYQLRQNLTYDRLVKYSTSYKKQKSLKNQLMIEQTLNFDPLNFYFDVKIKTQFNFLIAINRKKINDQTKFNFITTPDKVDVKFAEEFYLDVIEFSKRSECNFKRISEVIRFCVGSLNEIKINPQLRFEKEMIFRLFLYAFYKDLFNTTNPRVLLDDLEKFVLELKLNNEIFDTIYTFLVEKKCDAEFYEYSILTRILREIKSGSYNSIIDQYSVESFDLFVNYNLKVSKLLWNLMNDFNELFQYNNAPFMNFKWYNLSAGEEALLTVFSELWESINKSKKEHILFCIDEAELYLHPEWQRNLIKYLNTFFEIFLDKKKQTTSYQVILSSHSPFVTGDIPKFSLVFIAKPDKTLDNPNPFPIIIDSQSQKATFGGNIFSLYKDSFFLKDFFSEFSKEWINEAFNKINGKESRFLNNDDIVKFAQLIGEPIIKDAILNKVSSLENELWISRQIDK